MKQHEAVIEALEQLGGVATLAALYRRVLEMWGGEWRTKTPQATIRRIVQTRQEIYKLKPGLYGLAARREQNEARGNIAETEANRNSEPLRASNHAYYQGLLLLIGKLRRFECWAPNQDKNKPFLNQTIGDVRSMNSLPSFSYPRFVSRSATVDVIWFNNRGMPNSLFEVETTTDIQNSLLKFNDMQDFHTQMVIVSDKARKPEFDSKLRFLAFADIRERVAFLAFEALVKRYELVSLEADSTVRL